MEVSPKQKVRPVKHVIRDRKTPGKYFIKEIQLEFFFPKVFQIVVLTVVDKMLMLCLVSTAISELVFITVCTE